MFARDCLSGVCNGRVSHRPGAVTIILDPPHPLPYLLEHKRSSASFFVLLASRRAGRSVPISSRGVPVEDIAVSPVNCRAPAASGKLCLVSNFPLRTLPVLYALGITERVHQLLHVKRWRKLT